MGRVPDQGTAGLDGQEQKVGAAFFFLSPFTGRRWDEGQREHPNVGAAPHLPARPQQQLRCSYGGWTGIFPRERGGRLSPIPALLQETI